MDSEITISTPQTMVLTVAQRSATLSRRELAPVLISPRIAANPAFISLRSAAPACILVRRSTFLSQRT